MSTQQIALEVESSVAKALLESFRGSIEEVIRILGNKYDFDAKEALELLNLSNEVVEKIKQKKEKKEKVVVEKKSEIPLPFTSVDENLCQGMIPNHGLYTQCQSVKKDGCDYCKKCNSQAEKNETKKPNNGNINEREVSLVKKVVPYVKIMKKLNLTKEQVLEEAKKNGVEVGEHHFEEEVKVEKRGRKAKSDKSESTSKKGRGRPKKEETTVELSEQDVFSQIITEANNDTESVVDDLSELTEASENSDKESKKSIEKADKEAKKAQEKADKETKKAQEKADKEAKKTQEKADKEAKKAQEKADKEAKKAQEKADKKVQEKAAKKEVAKQVVEKVEQVVEKVEQVVEKVEQVVEEPEKLKKLNHNGTMYYRGEQTNVVYNYEAAKKGDFIELGLWNPTLKSIEFNKVEDDEEEEEEEDYDE